MGLMSFAVASFFFQMITLFELLLCNELGDSNKFGSLESAAIKVAHEFYKVMFENNRVQIQR